MVPQLYAMDSQIKAQDLATTILSSSTPPTILSSCSAIETFLTKHTTDQNRSFFSITFPALICKVFGFDDSSRSGGLGRGWIDQIQGLGFNDGELLSGRVFNLLSPNGVLFNSIFSVDRYELVKYLFPVERLPEWMRFMFQNERDCRVLPELCPLFKGRVKEDSSKSGCYQVQLNVLEYYMFWFAYYPVCKGNNESLDTGVIRSKSRRFRFHNWTVLGSGSGQRDPGKKIECGLYMRLLYAYLRNFVPKYGSEVAHQPYRSSLLHYSPGYDGSGSVLVQMDFVVYTFVHFWLVDNDFSPLFVNVCRSFGVVFPFRAVLGETPSTPGLGEVVMLFVKYLNSGLVGINRGSEGAQHGENPRWRGSGFTELSVSGMGSLTYWNSLIQRPLYRFILRTFLFCPMGTSIKNAYQIFGIWISYMEPWKMSLQDFSELDALIHRPNENSRIQKTQCPSGRDAPKDSCESAYGYTSSWEGYVLSNYLYYSSLVMHFLGFAHKFLHTDVETIIQMVWKALDLLTSSKELMDLMKKVDTAFHLKASVSSSAIFDSSYKFVPSIREQLQDWEDGLCESDADGSFLHENWNQDLRLLSDGEDSGHELLQLLILRAESEIQAVAGNNLARNLQTLESLKSKMCILFGNRIGRSTSITPEAKQCRRTSDEIFTPRSARNHRLTEVKYKGDIMKRPISDGEIAWLTRLLVRLSDWLNDIIGLNQIPDNNQKPHSWSYVELCNADANKEGGPKEAMKMVLCSVGSWIMLMGLAVVKFMKEHELRVNLRVLASKKVMVLLILSAVFFSVLKKVFRHCLG
ncbi:hypothetical protein GIB67_042818 [Kingdonia uniflora]|uniref:Sphingomyelin phosphodiesterase 4 n=1 Tax=Kingdonia uniflora TaxID=39325 RepID=A0A7J7P012_9MAGN|nr:hypothetical protein GIB67_042818 [Kingdonia uniflora]